MKRALLLLALLAGTLPPLAAAAHQPDLAALRSVPRQSVPPASVRALVERAAGKDSPYRFAVAVDVPLPASAGQWTIEGDTAVWRARLHSLGALSLSASFPQARLPAGTELRTYDPAGRLVHGPFDASKVTRTGLWTPLVRGEEVVVEARMPRDKAGEFSLGRAKAYHGFRDWKAATGKGAGSCNIDTTCSSAASWTTDAGSVAKITIGGVIACSGQLVNNVKQDEQRLFLTAAHCGVGTDEGPGESVIFYFNYVGPCTNNGTDPQPVPAFQGVVELADDAIADFSLLLIVDEAPMPAGAYFAGWDATGAVSSNGASIHHPVGDERKISFFSSTPTPTTLLLESGECKVDAYEVHWSQGTTEAGSSGGGLWNSSHRLIGVLSGGLADCSSQSSPDYYGRIDRAWTANASTRGQLKAHLDPDGTCIATVPGLAAGAVPISHPTDVPRICSAPAVTCDTGTTRALDTGRGGGSAGTLVAGLLLGLLLRRRRR